jgi:hypothetical protein
MKRQPPRKLNATAHTMQSRTGKCIDVRPAGPFAVWFSRRPEMSESRKRVFEFRHWQVIPPRSYSTTEGGRWSRQAILVMDTLLAHHLLAGKHSRLRPHGADAPTAPCRGRRARLSSAGLGTGAEGQALRGKNGPSGGGCFVHQIPIGSSPPVSCGDSGITAPSDAVISGQAFTIAPRRAPDQPTPEASDYHADSKLNPPTPGTASACTRRSSTPGDDGLGWVHRPLWVKFS